MNALAQWLQIAPSLLEVRDRAYAQDVAAVCPPRDLCLRALESVAPADVSVVVLGQDPYHTPGKANGLAFGYHPGYAGPVDSSLANILAEIEGRPPPLSLEHLPPQGVLLLNTRLTVLAGRPLSHAGPAGPGWEAVVDRVLAALHPRADVVWLLLGAEALGAATRGRRLWGPAVCTSHPCRFSARAGRRPFVGSRCFDKVNEYLRCLERREVVWHGRD